MKGIVFDIKHFAIHDGPGIRQTVFLKGCPLSCWWCHNPESQSPNIEKYIKTNKLDGKEFKVEKNIGYYINSEELFKVIKDDEVFFNESDGGVTFSGGEPLLQHDFLYEIMLKCQQNNIHVTLDTTGFASNNVFSKIAEVTDLFLYDIKVLDNSNHIKYTGVPIDNIIKNLKWLDEQNRDVILRMPVIPNITNTVENISQIKKLLSSLSNINKIDLLPYHNISNSKYDRFGKQNKMTGINSLQASDVVNLQQDFENLGFTVSVGG